MWPWVNDTEIKTTVQDAGTPASHHPGVAVDVERVIRTKVAPITVLWNSVGIVAAALLPGLMLGLPVLCAMLLPRGLLLLSALPFLDLVLSLLPVLVLLFLVFVVLFLIVLLLLVLVLLLICVNRSSESEKQEQNCCARPFDSSQLNHLNHFSTCRTRFSETSC